MRTTTPLRRRVALLPLALLLGLGACSDNDDAPTAPTTTRDEPVEVAGAPVGRVIVVDDGVVARAVWTNGATTFQLDGPAGTVEAFYDAFGM